jgi:hypothetical protein
LAFERTRSEVSQADETLETTIRQAASEPASFSIDGQAGQAQRIPDLIATDKYLSGKEAAQKRKFPLLIRRIRPPGTV